MKEYRLNISEKLYLKWSKDCYKCGKDGVKWERIEKLIKKMFNELKKGEEK